MRKFGLGVAASCLAFLGGLGVANAAVTITSIALSQQTGSGYSTTATFNGLPLNTTTPFVDSGISFSGKGIVVAGNKNNVYAAPTGDTSQYLVIQGTKGNISPNFISISPGQTEGKFGLYWGSPDSFNNLTFYLGSSVVGTFTGLNVAPNSKNSYFVNFAGLYDRVVLQTGSPNFEVDNVSISGVPELSTWMMMLLGFSGLGLALYSKNRRKEAGEVAMMAA